MLLLWTSAPAQEPGKFRLVVVRGEGDQHNIKKGRATSQAVVEVRDQNDQPVAGVILTFALPTQGASGTFVGGAQVTSLATNSLGQASVTFAPNQVAGQFALKVTGSVQGQSLSTSVAQSNLAATAGVSTGAMAAIVGVAAAAAVGVAVALNGGDKPTPATNAPPPAAGLRLGINPGGIQIGAPRP
jgi:hypothetical protein